MSICPCWYDVLPTTGVRPHTSAHWFVFFGGGGGGGFALGALVRQVLASGQSVKSQLCLADLGGSEQLKKSKAEGERMLEAIQVCVVFLQSVLFSKGSACLLVYSQCGNQLSGCGGCNYKTLHCFFQMLMLVCCSVRPAAADQPGSAEPKAVHHRAARWVPARALPLVDADEPAAGRAWREESDLGAGEGRFALPAAANAARCGVPLVQHTWRVVP